MITVRPSILEDIPAQRELWKLAFGDSDQYIDNFYNTCYRPDRVVVLEEDGAVKSMTAWFDTTFVLPGQGEYRSAYLYAVATHPDCRGRGLAGKLLAGADEYFRSLGIPAVTTVPAEPSLHDFFGANGFRECFRILGGKLRRDEIPVPPSNVLRPASTEEYSRVREELLKDIPHIAYPEDALAYQAGCCALGDGGLFVGDTPAGPVCLCAERADDELVIVKELLGPAGMGRAVFPDLPRIAPARRGRYGAPDLGMSGLISGEIWANSLCSSGWTRSWKAPGTGALWATWGWPLTDFLHIEQKQPFLFVERAVFCISRWALQSFGCGDPHKIHALLLPILCYTIHIVAKRSLFYGRFLQSCPKTKEFRQNHRIYL